jgi:hypothetical protein
LDDQRRDLAGGAREPAGDRLEIALGDDGVEGQLLEGDAGLFGELGEGIGVNRVVGGGRPTGSALGPLLVQPSFLEHELASFGHELERLVERAARFDLLGQGADPVRLDDEARGPGADRFELL